MRRRLKLYTTIPLLFLLFTLHSCANSREEIKEKNQDVVENSSSVPFNMTEDEMAALRANNITRGQLIIKLSDSGLRSLGDYRVMPEELNLRSLPSETQSILRSIGTKRMTRLFPPAGEFEERTKREGLDRWMILEFDEQQELPETRSIVRSLEDFEYVEFSYVQTLPKVKVTPMSADEIPKEEKADAISGFNDPFLSLQWHYYNNGTRVYSKPRADINLFEAWEVETGSPKVKVCIVDGGIDLKHEDLVDNLDIENSYNFIKDKDGKDHGKNIYPDVDGHGTHVAGTVAAVNNNGKGVAGIAGGDGKGKGIRLISAQVYGYSNDKTPPSSIGIKYGADHGAVISQNSWGYRYPGPRQVLPHDKESIDYFIKYAGMDKDGKEQLPDSPMAGGVVIFAAGNDYVGYDASPAMYSEVIAVSSMASDFTKSEFTNYGSWVDIMAPGGDQGKFGKFGGVFSTLPKNKYGFMQGTSMACPHVSGIAALVVSKYGKQGFTNKQLKEMLTTALRPYDINALNHANYRGKLGAGYIDAARALDAKGANNTAPATPANVVATADYTYVDFTWDVSKDADAHNQVAQFYDLYITDKAITNDSELDQLTPIKIFGETLRVGQKVKYTSDELTDEGKYFYAIRAVDRWGAKSGVVKGEFQTKKNEAPAVISGLSDMPLILTNRSTLDLVLTVKDPEGHKWTLDKSGILKGVVIKRNSGEDKVNITIYPEQPEGEYTFTLKLIDEHKKAKEYPITYKVVKYQAPRFVGSKDIIVGLKDKGYKIALTDIISFAQGMKTAISITGAKDNIIDAKVNEGMLILDPKAIGVSPLTLTYDDGINRSSSDLKISVVQDIEASVYLLYPIPTKTELNIALNRELKSATFVITSVRGEVLLREEKIIDNRHHVTLDVHKLVAGTYTLTVVSAKGTYRTSFLKH